MQPKKRRMEPRQRRRVLALSIAPILTILVFLWGFGLAGDFLGFAPDPKVPAPAEFTVKFTPVALKGDGDPAIAVWATAVLSPDSTLDLAPEQKQDETFVAELPEWSVPNSLSSVEVVFYSDPSGTDQWSCSPRALDPNTRSGPGGPGSAGLHFLFNASDLLPPYTQLVGVQCRRLGDVDVRSNHGVVEVFRAAGKIEIAGSPDFFLHSESLRRIPASWSPKNYTLSFERSFEAGPRPEFLGDPEPPGTSSPPSTIAQFGPEIWIDNPNYVGWGRELYVDSDALARSEKWAWASALICSLSIGLLPSLMRPFFRARRMRPRRRNGVLRVARKRRSIGPHSRGTREQVTSTFRVAQG